LTTTGSRVELVEMGSAAICTSPSDHRDITIFNNISSAIGDVNLLTHSAKRYGMENAPVSSHTDSAHSPDFNDFVEFRDRQAEPRFLLQIVKINQIGM
jgi:Ca2+-binding RTX toxin-like protein